MRAQVLLRKIHYWISIVVALPLLVVITTGLLLQVKKEIHWIQPDEQRGRDGPPQVGFEQVLAICRAQPQVSVDSWNDIDQVDYRPDRQLLKVSTNQGWELQIDPVTGDVLQVAKRRSDLIESLHDGSWFSDYVKSWVFLPSGVLLGVLWITGMYLFVLPYLRKRPKQGN